MSPEAQHLLTGLVLGFLAMGAIALYAWWDASKMPIYSDVTPPRPESWTYSEAHLTLLHEELGRAWSDLPADLRELIEARGIGIEISEDDSPNYGVWVPRLQTIFIYSQTPAPEARRVLMHEIAHALGFSHEDMAAKFPGLVG
jgi:hypothetical protein